MHLAPFDEAVARMCEAAYDPKTPFDTLSWVAAGIGVGAGLDTGLREPGVRDRLLAPHPAENPRTTALNENMRMYNEVFASPQFQQNLASAARRTGKSPAVGVFAVLIEHFVEVHGPLDQTRRMPQFAGLVNHCFRFGLMLARDHPSVAADVRAWTNELGDKPTKQRRPFWKFW